MFSDHNCTNLKSLTEIYLGNSQICRHETEEITREIRKCFEINENQSIYQNWESALITLALLYNMESGIVMPPAFLFFNVYLFLWERESQRAHALVGRGSARGGVGIEDTKRSLHWQQLDAGLKPMNRKMMTWAKVRHSTDWATQVSIFLDFKFQLALEFGI